MPRILYFDCSAGIAGDMLLGALLDAGLPLDALRAALGSLAIDRHMVSLDRVRKAGIAAAKFRVHDRPDVAETAGNDAGGHSHHHPHRSLAEIEEQIDRSALSAEARATTRRLFRRLAEVEAAVHDMPVEQVHLHEVGALDSIIDIAGTVFGLEWFGAGRIVSSPLNVGSGTVKTAHGVLPVPAPATARLLEGIPVYSSGITGELVTPTGALLAAEFASSFGPLPAMRIGKIGYGAGDRDLPGAPNVLRVIVGEEEAAPHPGDRVVVIECEIDDMNPQIFGPLMDRLYEAGAVEVFYIAVQMKKGRPGTLVTAVAPIERREALASVLFRETTTIGLRYIEMARACLDREIVSVDTPLGPIRFKVARRGSETLNAVPEFDDCVRIADAHGLPVKQVQAIAFRAFPGPAGN